jgi:multidrug efflux pump subunit AcrA (membrane-fusion protein)
MLTTTRFSVAPVALVLGVTLTACSKAAPPPEPVSPVQVAPVVKGSIRDIVTADAVLYPRDQANIMPKITAPIRRFLVNRGDHVKEGQLLAELENRDLVAAATESQGQLAQAESTARVTTASVPEQMTKAQTDLEAARQQFDAGRKVLESRQQLFKEGAIARKQVDEAQVAEAQARAQFETAQQHLKALEDVGKTETIKGAAAQVEAARGHHDSIQAQVDYSVIRSPITGVITDRSLYQGELANTGMPLFTVMDMSAIVARLNLSQQQAKDIKVGSESTLTPADGSKPVTGKVTIVSPAVDPNSTTVQVWVQAANPGERLRAGASVHVAIVVATTEDATIIPTSAVLPSEEGGSIVIGVDDKNVAHHKKVKIGVREPDIVQVLDGVQPGERVVTVGGLGLDDMAKVSVVKPGASADDTEKPEADKPKAGADKEKPDTDKKEEDAK